MVADMDQFELAKISLQQAGMDQRLNLESKSGSRSSFLSTVFCQAITCTSEEFKKLYLY